MRNGVLIALITPSLVAAGLSASFAQSMPPGPGAERPGSPSLQLSVLRVQTQFNIALAGVPIQDLDQQKSAHDRARRAVYEMAAGGCTTLSSVFQAECRVTAVTANSSLNERGSGLERIVATGSATYELTAKAR